MMSVFVCSSTREDKMRTVFCPIVMIGVPRLDDVMISDEEEGFLGVVVVDLFLTGRLGFMGLRRVVGTVCDDDDDDDGLVLLRVEAEAEAEEEESGKAYPYSKIGLWFEFSWEDRNIGGGGGGTKISSRTSSNFSFAAITLLSRNMRNWDISSSF